MALFVSKFINKIDRKGRVSVPATFRAALHDQSFQGIIVFPSFTIENVVEGCGMNFLEEIANAAAAQYGAFSTEQSDLSTALYANSHQLAWDPEGRVILPEEIMAYANITDQVAFVGMADRFQIWEPEAHRAHAAAAMARLRQNPLNIIRRKVEA